MSGPLVMPFGKHRGCAIARLPIHYLKWLSGLDLRHPLRAAITAELARRAGPQTSGGSAPQASARTSSASRPIPTPALSEIDW